jgi:hypothetical protein
MNYRIGAWNVHKVLLITLSVAFLLVSLVYSGISFTGYVVTERVSSGANWTALGFLLLGVLTFKFYIKRFKE